MMQCLFFGKTEMEVLKFKKQWNMSNKEWWKVLGGGLCVCMGMSLDVEGCVTGWGSNWEGVFVSE